MLLSLKLIKMVSREDVRYARNLLKSINAGIDKLELGSDCEEGYLNEKITNLYNLLDKDE